LGRKRRLCSVSVANPYIQIVGRHCANARRGGGWEKKNDSKRKLHSWKKKGGSQRSSKIRRIFCKLLKLTKGGKWVERTERNVL